MKPTHVASRSFPLLLSLVLTTATSTAQRVIPLAAEQGAFVPNAGQWDPAAQFRARFGPTTVFLQPGGWVARFDDGLDRAAAYPMRFRGGNDVAPVGDGCLPGRVSYFVGERERWVADVERYAGARYTGVYNDGIDVIVYDKAGVFAYDVELAAGADLARFEIEIAGVDGLTVEDGALVFETPIGAVLQSAPVAFVTDSNGGRHPVACDYELRGANRYGFRAPGWSELVPLTIDPGLVYATNIGTSADDNASDVHVDPDTGVMTVLGRSDSAQFPATTGAFATSSAGGYDVFAIRLDPSLPAGPGQLLWATLIGGSGSESPRGVHVDGNGVVTIVGDTASFNFPTTGGSFQPTANPGRDVFITRLDPSQAGAAQLVASTYFGGSGGDYAEGMCVDDASGEFLVVGQTDSADLPTSPGAFDATYAGWDDAFLARFDASLTSLSWGTYFGGTFVDGGASIATANGLVYAGGGTRSSDLPTTPGTISPTSIYRAGFVAVFDPSLTGSQQLVASTYLGGSSIDLVTSLALQDSKVYVAGQTQSSDFPTTASAYQPALAGSTDFFIAILDPALLVIGYSTYLGGINHENFGGGIVVSPSGIITLSGTGRETYPTTPGAYQTTASQPNPSLDAVVSRLDPNRPPAEQLLYSTFVGWSGNQWGSDPAVDARGFVTVVGQSNSPGLGTVNPYQPNAASAWDGFAVQLDMLATGVSAYGSSDPGCDGPLPISAIGVPDATNGNPNFEITCDAVPSNGVGVAVIGLARSDPPQQVAGLDIWVDLTPAHAVSLIVPTPQGNAGYVLPIPAAAGLVGVRVFAQFAWAGPNGSAPCPPSGLSASNALEITLQ